MTTYDAGGPVWMPIRLKNGTFYDRTAARNTYSYTEQNRLLYMGVTNGAGALLRGYAYQLNPVGYRTAVAEGTNAYGGAPRVRRQVAYQYDGPALPSVYRLTQETLFDSASNVMGSILHAYDPVGNRSSRTTNNFAFVPTDPSLANQSLSFDSRDQILSPITGTPVGDLNGNTTNNELGVATGDQYDAENHLIKRGSTIQIGYDHEGNRVSKTANGTNTYYLLDDRNPSGYVQVLAEYSSVSSNLAPNVTYAYGLELISQQQSSGSVHYYCFDGQGSVRVLTDSTAALTGFYDHEGYGQVLATSGTTPDNYLYTGQQWDPDLGMYYQRARYFNPGTGRFWTADPHQGDQEDPQSLHCYTYCRGNPINRIDPKGLADYKLRMIYTGVDTGTGLGVFADPETWGGGAVGAGHSALDDVTGTDIVVGPIGDNDDLFNVVSAKVSDRHLGLGTDRITRISIVGHGPGPNDDEGYLGTWNGASVCKSAITLEGLQSVTPTPQLRLMKYLNLFTAGHCDVRLQACFQAKSPKARKMMGLIAQLLGANVTGWDDEYAVKGWGNQWTVDPKDNWTKKNGTPFKGSWADTQSYFSDFQQNINWGAF